MRKVLLGVPFVLALMGLLLVGAVSGDTLPEVSFETDRLYVAEDAGQVNINVSLNPSSTMTVTVGYATVEATALAGQDFVSATGALTFTPGITLQTFPLTLLDNALPDDDRSLLVVLTAPQSATLGLYSALTITITDDGDPYVALMPLVAKRWPPLPYVPTLNAISNSDGDGSYTLIWSELPKRLADTYIVQEAKDGAFTTDVVQLHPVSGQSYALSYRSFGTNYYRVKGSNTWGDSDWSDVRSVVVEATPYNPKAQDLALSLRDMPSGYQLNGEESGSLSESVNLSDGYEVQYENFDRIFSGTPVVYNNVGVFRSAPLAQAYIQRVGQNLAADPEFVPISCPGYGDETIAYRGVMTEGGFDFVTYYVFFRRANLTETIFTVGLLGVSAFDDALSYADIVWGKANAVVALQVVKGSEASANLQFSESGLDAHIVPFQLAEHLARVCFEAQAQLD